MTDDLGNQRDRVMKTFKGIFKSWQKEESKDDLSQQRQKSLAWIKEHQKWLVYLVLLGIILFASSIRVQNFPIIHDVTDGSYVSTDLDSHIYLKYAKVIQEKGYLPDVDFTRFVPLGAPTANYAFPAYIIYYQYKIMNFFDPTVTIEYADVVYPVVAFAFGILFFFLLARRIFGGKVALLSSFLLAVMPAFLQRTMGGSSDHDALGIMFLFLALYLFAEAWLCSEQRKSLLWAGAAGIATGLTGLSWGAWKFVALICGVFVLLEFLFDKVERRQMYIYTLWLVVSIIVMVGWVPLFPLSSLVTSLTTAPILFVLAVLWIDLAVQKYGLQKKIPLKVPRPFLSVILTLIIGAIAMLVFLGPTGVQKQFVDAKQLLLHPMGKDRWELTVAEQHQPFFKDVIGFFGPYILRIPVLYLFFLVGIVLAFQAMIKTHQDKLKPTMAFIAFIFLLLMSRYAPDSQLNGTSPISIFLYFGSMLALAAVLLYYIFHSYRHDNFGQFKHWDSRYLYVLIWVLFMIVAARGAIRLVFIFAPVVALLAGYAIVELAERAWKMQKVAKWAVLFVLAFILFGPIAAVILAGLAIFIELGNAIDFWEKQKFSTKLLALIACEVLVIIVLIFILISPSAFATSLKGQGILPTYIQDSSKQGQYSGAPYNAQWQIAGKWVKENVAKDAVFGHWWDYGYWVQNGWERSSVLDGANKVKYWNYLMGRNVLTAHSQAEALPFLYAHNTSHYLIVADEIGKYTAYSSIGSDGDYDRYSWITTFVLNPQGTQETRNTTVYFYQGGHSLDQDFVWEGRVFPRRSAGIGAVFVPIHQEEVTVGNETKARITVQRPGVALVYQNQRVDVPLTCIYVNGQFILFDGPGYNGCFSIIPFLDGSGKVQNPLGGGLLVSEEGRRALWVNLYVFDQKNPEYDTSAFTSIYEDKYLSTTAVVQGRMMGPIKIWQIDYPKGFTITEEEKATYLGGNELLPDYFFQV